MPALQSGWQKCRVYLQYLRTPIGGKRRTQLCFCHTMTVSLAQLFTLTAVPASLHELEGVFCATTSLGEGAAPISCVLGRDGHDASRTGLAYHAQRTRSGRKPPDTSSCTSRRADLGVRSARCQRLYGSTAGLARSPAGAKALPCETSTLRRSRSAVPATVFNVTVWTHYRTSRSSECRGRVPTVQDTHLLM